jgi:CubicO group peptidase (beta-lactamase class C family)
LRLIDRTSKAGKDGVSFERPQDVPDFRGPLGMFTPERDSSFGTPAPARRSLRSTYKHMSKKLINSLLFGGIMLTTIPSAFAQANPMQQFEGQTIDEMIGSFMKEHQIPGMTLAIVQAPYIPRVVGYGSADIEHGFLASPKTLWNVGQITHGFTAVAVMQLSEAENSPSTPLASMSNICRRRGSPSRSAAHRP